MPSVCDSLIRNSLDSLTASVADIKEYVQPDWVKSALDVICILSFVLSAYAMLQVVWLEYKIKWQRKVKKFVSQCEIHKATLKQNTIPSDIDKKIKDTLNTFLDDIPKIHLIKRYSLKKKIKLLDKKDCDKILLLNNTMIEFKPLTLQ